MEQYLESNATNNNVIDDLEVLKEQHLSKANDLINENAKYQLDNETSLDNENLSSNIGPAENKITLESLVKGNETAIGQSDKLTVDNLLESNDEQLRNDVQDLLVDTEKDILSPVVEQKNDLIDEQPKDTNQITVESSKTAELDQTAESTKDHSSENLNNTSNTNLLDLSNQENLTSENSLEQLRDNAAHSVIENLLDECSVKENVKISDLSQTITLDSTQDSIHQAANETNEETHENLLVDLSLQNQCGDESKGSCNLADESTKEPSLMDISGESQPDQFTEQEKDNLTEDTKREISLMDFSNDNQLNQKNEEEIPENITLFDQLNQTKTESQTVNEDHSNVVSEKSEFFEDLNNKLNKTVDEFLSDIKTSDPVDQTEKIAHQENQTSLEDFVIKDAIDSTENDLNDLTKESESCIKKKADDVLDKKDEVKQEIEKSFEESKPESDKQIKVEEIVEPIEVVKTEEVSPEIQSKKEEESIEVTNQEPAASKSKDDIFTQSQELLKKADQLIAEKKNQIAEINIPGLDIPTDVNTSQNQPETTLTEEAVKEESATEEPVKQATLEQPVENAVTKGKQNNQGRRCLIM